MELPNQTVIQGDRQVRGKAHGAGFKGVEGAFQPVLGLQQVGFFRLDVLAEVIHLNQRNQARVLVRLELGQLVQLQGLYEEFDKRDTVVIAVSQEDADLKSHGKFLKRFEETPPFDIVADLKREKTKRSHSGGASRCVSSAS